MSLKVIRPKKLSAVFTAGALGLLGSTLGLSALAPQLITSHAQLAQEPETVPGIDIPYNPASDSETMIPEGFGQSDSPLDDSSRVVIGRDEREPVLTREFPWLAMGRLEWQYQGDIISTCTATLVGPGAILTNSHCLVLPIPNEETGADEMFVDSDIYEYFVSTNGELPTLVFKPSLINNVSLDESTIVTYESGWSSETAEAKDDWAVLQLDQDLGNTYGWLGWRDIDFTNQAMVEESFEKINLLGYAGDFPTAGLEEFGAPTETAGVDRACSILGVWQDESVLHDTLIHDCDTNPGASGGPIFAKFDDDKYYLVGLHARSTPLASPVTLPNGVTTDVVNGGVSVARWNEAASNASR